MKATSSATHNIGQQDQKSKCFGFLSLKGKALGTLLWCHFHLHLSAIEEEFLASVYNSGSVETADHPPAISATRRRSRCDWLSWCSCPTCSSWWGSRPPCCHSSGRQEGKDEEKFKTSYRWSPTNQLLQCQSGMASHWCSGWSCW